MPKISACLIVRNEERLIRRCLDSVKNVVDEIIVIHDGECTDKTLNICSEYANIKIFIQQFAGFMEAHLPFALRAASSDWILRIDADEFLSLELQNKLQLICEKKEVAAYKFIWPIWNGEKYLSMKFPDKISLFQKDKISFAAIPHYLMQVEGNIVKIKQILEHQPLYINYTWRVFREKWLKWAKLQAQLYKSDFDKIEKYNSKEIDWPFIIKLRKKIPLLLIPIDFIYTFCKMVFNNAYYLGFAGVKITFLNAMYKASVDYYLIRK